ncbi:MAG: hypothetical protein KAV45_08880 [Calditrichia bacterium]|nr:hypothetical protein [Calditrichia bacterium]
MIIKRELIKQIAYEVKLSPTPSDLTKVKTLCGALGYKDFHTISRRYTEKLDVLYGFQL